MCNRSRNRDQEYKEKHQAEHELFKDPWKNPYAMFASDNNPDIFSQELNRPRVSGDPFEDRMLKYHCCKNS